jgi:hypothetical protein
LVRSRGPSGRRAHFHICESNGGPFGRGNLDFKSILATLRECPGRIATNEGSRAFQRVETHGYRRMSLRDAGRRPTR